MHTPCFTHRRAFLKSSLLGGMAAMALGPRQGGYLQAADDAAPPRPASRVAVTAGDDRADNIFRGMDAFRDEIARAIGNRRVVVKPNMVAVASQLAATHADHLAGILEFLKSIGKLGQAVIAESAGNGSTLEGFSNYGYPAMAAKYGVKLVDLDREPVQTVHVFDEKDFRPHAVRMSRLLLARDSFLISAAKLKTHDRVVATLSLKNIVFGAPVKDEGFRWGGTGKPGTTTQKPIAHGSGIRGINYNLFALAQRLRPSLAVIDGYEGLEGNGPVNGTPVDHRVAVVSPDWLAADRVSVELMGIDFQQLGYLNYCAGAGMGQTDLAKIEILGEPIARHVKKYKLHEKVEQQLIWMTPPNQA